MQWMEGGLRSPTEHSERHSMPQSSRSARATVVCGEQSVRAVRAVGAKTLLSARRCCCRLPGALCDSRRRVGVREGARVRPAAESHRAILKMRNVACCACSLGTRQSTQASGVW